MRVSFTGFFYVVGVRLLTKTIAYCSLISLQHWVVRVIHAQANPVINRLTKVWGQVTHWGLKSNFHVVQEVRIAPE
jgi:hypothetical protein